MQMVDPDRAERMYYAIVMGTPKAHSDMALTDEESAFWDVIERQVQAGNDQGMMWASPGSLDDADRGEAETVSRPLEKRLPVCDYAINRELVPGQLLAYLGPPEGEPDSLCLYFDHYGPMASVLDTSGIGDHTWYEHGYTRWWRPNDGEVITSDVKLVVALMSLGNGYWTWVID